MKAAILGMGAMGQVHKEVYESLGIETLTYDVRDGPNWIPTVREADIVSICSPDNFHAEQIIAAFKMGKHVFCEKPLCHTRKEFEAIKAAYNKECALGMNFPLRWHLPFVEAKEKLGSLGNVHHFHARYNYGRRHKIDDGWRGDIPYSIVMGGGIHLIDVLLWMGFDLTPEHSCRTVQDPWQTVSLLAMQRGFGILTCDFVSPLPHCRTLALYGEKDSLTIEDTKPTDKGRALQEFLYHLRSRDPVTDVPTPEEIFRVHEIGLSL